MDGRTEVPTAVTVPPHTFTADSRTARAATRALMRAVAWPRLGIVIFVPLAFGTAALFDDTTRSASTGLRLLVAFIATFIVCLPVWLVAIALAVGVNLRIMKRRFFEGAVWQTAFEPDAFVVSGPLQSSRSSYSIVRSVVVEGDFVVLRHRGTPFRFVYPRVLVPDDALALLQGSERQHPERARARRVRVAIAVVAAVGLAAFFGAGWSHREPPDYRSAGEIAVAMHDHEIDCVYEPIIPASRVGAESAGRCTGDGYVVDIYVYPSEAARFDRLAELNAYWCRRGRRSGGWIAAHRWFLAVAHDDASDGPDLKEVSGGAFVPLECVQHTQSV